MSPRISLWVWPISLLLQISAGRCWPCKNIPTNCIYSRPQANAAHRTFNLPSIPNSGNKHKLLPWVSCITTNSSVSTFKNNTVATFNKLGHTFSLLQTIQSTLSSSQSSEDHFPLVLHSMTHEKAGSQSPHSRYQSRFLIQCLSQIEVPEL